ncbi:peptidase M22, glycoprotease [Paucilactobacillus oligofermentans DSM 15707 = LMG 22743]|uniref:Peptidase M22, glycoprotease n=1 Tax=Paucilactobacillus oligofermentans DSM 15707 = LMG 22743 TaxID=1423778 RepID=A0A0R1RWS4_9LACO|nr:tRNA (adenosine(37)-N6)-threonylcarbamoyltransferase complex dimerization subunit type 1 TsaB [Paucilactobacillus oligofermentans]KRL57811.1 peptidase M22, glycoprotease [Paucilactobacillus oligofermentans DSM 15707 = LMG 22743]CUS26731.1 Uncharacterized protein YdiC [Paucilactobacillus oligofermentans DSM 15707 = LMG 22743]
MKILSIDTSNAPLAIALVEDDQLVAETTLNVTKNHSVFLMPVIEQLMKMASWTPAELNRIVVAKGPGSYTGVRIAVTTAKTLASTLKIELVGVSSLAVMAKDPAELTNLPVIAIFNARRNTVFTGGYQMEQGKLVSFIEDAHMELSELIEKINEKQQPVLIVGDILPEFKNQFETNSKFITLGNEQSSFPSAFQLGLMGAKINPVSDIDSFVPDYLRITEAEMNWQKSHPGELKKSYVREV